MNYIFISPHFPPCYYFFAVKLRELGVNVLGIAEEPYNNLRPELKIALTEYYWVPSLERYDDVLRAVGYFTHKYGKISRIESHNEYWMPLDAQLRQDFNVDGLRPIDMEPMRRKSAMKKVFQLIGANVAKGRLFSSEQDAVLFAKDVGYPIIVKPDIGVGSAYTYRVNNEHELIESLREQKLRHFFLEEYLTGTMVTFDGLTNQKGEIVFYNSLQYNKNLMDVVNNNEHSYYFNHRIIPDDLRDVGTKIVQAFNIRERFFHIEFFRTPNGELFPLEANWRPPGGFTMDMFNFQNDIDLYLQYAQIVTNNAFTAKVTRPYYCCYIGRKSHYRYTYTHSEVLKYHKEHSDIQIMSHFPVPSIFSRGGMGDYAYIFRTPNLESMNAFNDFIFATKG